MLSFFFPVLQGSRSPDCSHLGGNEVRYYLSNPAILQVLGLLLRFASATADADRGDIGDGDLNLSIRFDLHGLGD
jgi:hypothetical protein